jgi:hypothetical protein
MLLVFGNSGNYETICYSSDLSTSLCKVAKFASPGLAIIYFVNKVNNGADTNGFTIPANSIKKSV